MRASPSSTNVAHRISVALVTRNRPDSLARTLASLRGQAVQPCEVIVSDDSDEMHVDATRACVDAHAATYIRGPRRGLYANRNHVAAACRGTHVRSMDDDHEFPAGHFEACAAAVDIDPAAVWIISEFKPWETAGLPVRTPGQLNARGFSTAPADDQDCWALSDGASIYPRHVFTAGHRFDDHFKFGAAYLEFGSRLRWMGYRLRLVRDTWVLHHMDRLNRSFMDEETDRSASAFAMFCHAFVYQPTLKNRMLCLLQATREAATLRPAAARSLVRGWRAYRDRTRADSTLASNTRAAPQPLPQADVAPITPSS